MTRQLHFLLSLIVLFSLLLPGGLQAAPALAVDSATQVDAPAGQQDLPYFQETGFQIANAQFADYFAKRGGLRTFGYPVSRSFLFLGTQVQFFQRQIMQIRPDGGVGTLNILDVDLMPYTRINGSVFPAASAAVLNNAPDPAAPDYATKVIDFVRANAPDTWSGQAANFSQAFLNTVKYEEAFPNQEIGPGIMPSINLELWGVPTSQPAADPTNAGFVYLRFQRGIMHYDASTGVTQGLLLADYLKAILTGQNLPTDLDAQARTSRFYRQYNAARPQALSRPNELPGTDLTNAFTPQTPGSTPVPQPLRRTAPAYDPSRLGYGMAVHLWWQDQGRVTRMVNESGFGWVKQQIRWSDAEATRGNTDFSEIDRMVDHALAANLNIMFSVVSAPSWSRADGRTDGPPDDYADFATFMSALATRYQGQVRAYEIWNEQNFSREWGGGRINAGQYVELLKSAYTAIKAADPQAMVISGALTPNGFTDPNVAIDDALYLEQMYQYGCPTDCGIIKRFSDAIGAHAGGFNNPPEDDMTHHSVTTTNFKNHPSFYFRRIEQMHDVMVKYGDSNKKMWLTEFGWSTFNLAPGYDYGKDNTEADQASYLVRAFQMSRTRYPWMGVMFVWNLNFGTLTDLPVSDEKKPFGILNPDFTPRLAYTALRAMPK